mmetsp:Transcript_65702/g.192244  ORF Transcript_65702/g.192244 Transcript_65702/m.192244 type:complete len:119 (+) Transcript_65702:1686-2042(+)
MHDGQQQQQMPSWHGQQMTSGSICFMRLISQTTATEKEVIMWNQFKMAHITTLMQKSEMVLKGTFEPSRKAMAVHNVLNVTPRPTLDKSSPMITGVVFDSKKAESISVIPNITTKTSS